MKIFLQDFFSLCRKNKKPYVIITWSAPPEVIMTGGKVSFQTDLDVLSKEFGGFVGTLISWRVNTGTLMYF